MPWLTYTCKINNKPAQVLIDNTYYKQSPIKELPLLSWVGVYCKMPANGSFHNPDETSKLDEIEDCLFNFCEKYGGGWAVYTHRIGTSGIREYYIYHSEKAKINKAIVALISSYPDYKIEFDTTKDENWNEYKKYLVE